MLFTSKKSVQKFYVKDDCLQFGFNQLFNYLPDKIINNPSQLPDSSRALLQEIDGILSQLKHNNLCNNSHNLPVWRGDSGRFIDEQDELGYVPWVHKDVNADGQQQVVFSEMYCYGQYCEFALDGADKKYIKQLSQYLIDKMGLIEVKDPFAQEQKIETNNQSAPDDYHPTLGG